MDEIGAKDQPLTRAAWLKIGKSIVWGSGVVVAASTELVAIRGNTLNTDDASSPNPPPWSAGLWPLAEGDFADPRSLSINGHIFVSGTDYARLLRFDGDLTNASRTEFTTTVDFTLDGVNYGTEVWAWTPFHHRDGSWHAYYTYVHSPTCMIMHARPDPPTQRWTVSQPILKWKTVSKLLSVQGACYYDNRIQVDDNGKLYLVTNHPSGPGVQGDVSILALSMDGPGQMAPDWASTASVLLRPDLPKLKSERRDPGSSLSIVENTQIQRIHDTYVLFYSVGDYTLANYKIGLAFSKSLLGTYTKIYKSDTANVWNNTTPTLEVQYLMQSSVPTWPNYMHRFLSGPGIASLVNTTTNGPALLFHARHPSNQGARYLWLFSYLSLRPGKWDVNDKALLGEFIKLGGSCATPCALPVNQSQCRVKTDDGTVHAGCDGEPHGVRRGRPGPRPTTPVRRVRARCAPARAAPPPKFPPTENDQTVT
jgi:hypothetical protein